MVAGQPLCLRHGSSLLNLDQSRAVALTFGHEHATMQSEVARINSSQELMSYSYQTEGSCSADVQMELRVNGRVFSVDQLGPDFLILDDPIEHPPAEGEMMVSIDGEVKRWPVLLPEGVSPAKVRTPVADCPRIMERAGSCVRASREMR
jgi:hypothetical protein